MITMWTSFIRKKKEVYLRARADLQIFQPETDLQTMMGKLCHPSRK
jgi:hypothetical protein